MIGLRLPNDALEIVCVGAHPDDIEIGCGGTLLQLAATRQLTATVLVLTGIAERQDEARQAAALFLAGAQVTVVTQAWPDGRLPGQWVDVKQLLQEQASATRPDIVFTPRPDDAHQDHRLLASLVPTAWRDSLVLHYEIPKWDGDLGRVNHYVPMPEEVAHRKIALLHQSFPSQAGRDWWDDETFLALMRLRGVECRARYAEGFHVAKAILSLGT